MNKLELSKQNAWKEVEKLYKLIDKIGEGTYGTVMKAKDIAVGDYVAIKHMTDFSDHKYTCTRVLREIKIMKALHKLQPSFFTNLLDVIVTKDCKDVFLVMELERTDIRALLRSGEKVEF